MTLPQFRQRFSEFSLLGDPVVKAFLAAATLECNATAWGLKRAEGIGYLAAHKLALSPNGNSSMLIGKEGRTCFSAHYDSLREGISAGRSRVAK